MRTGNGEDTSQHDELLQRYEPSQRSTGKRCDNVLVWLDRMYQRFYIDRPFVRCVCEDPAKGCDKQRERDTAMGLFGVSEDRQALDTRHVSADRTMPELVGVRGLLAPGRTLPERTLRLGTGRHCCGGWLPLRANDSFNKLRKHRLVLIAQLRISSISVTQSRKFSYLVKKSTWSDVEKSTKKHLSFRQTPSCVEYPSVDHPMRPHEKMLVCSCFGVNRTCNDWPGLFGRYFRNLLEDVPYAVSTYDSGPALRHNLIVLLFFYPKLTLMALGLRPPASNAAMRSAIQADASGCTDVYKAAETSTSALDVWYPQTRRRPASPSPSSGLAVGTRTSARSTRKSVFYWAVAMCAVATTSKAAVPRA